MLYVTESEIEKGTFIPIFPEKVTSLPQGTEGPVSLCSVMTHAGIARPAPSWPRRSLPLSMATH